MASRSTHVTLTNATGSNLLRKSISLEHGVWTTRPPQIIGDRGEWASESDGFMTGTEGHAVYTIEDGGGEVCLHWNNPFIGSNSYHHSVSPQAPSDGTGEGFSVIHLGGGGDNAAVEFQLHIGFCEVDENTGEVTCTQASPFQPEPVPATPTADTSALFAAIWQVDNGPAFQARHNLSADAYQQTFDQLTNQGFRLTHVSGYTVNGQERFAAIWQADNGPAFQARHNLSADAYQQTFDQLTGQGFRLTCVSGYTVNGEGRFAAIWQADNGPAFQARHNLSADAYQQTFDQLTGQGFRLCFVQGWGTA